MSQFEGQQDPLTISTFFVAVFIYFLGDRKQVFLSSQLVVYRQESRAFWDDVLLLFC